jgi:protein-S-isoprenylcysteine O-methyltransferase Ste14
MHAAVKQEPPRWASFVGAYNAYMTQNLLGGSRRFKIAWAINCHKALTPAVVVLLMFGYQSFSAAAWVYLALHGTYCLCWLLKHVAFRDPRWETRVTIGGAAFTFVLLATYWVAPFLLISNVLNRPGDVAPSWLLALCIGLLVLGATVMMTSDCQKRFTLRYRAGLIAEGMFKRIRHPNYLGEMMVYASFALLVRHWIPWVVLAYWWTCVFLVNMLIIEASLSRYPEWAEYRRRTSMLIPWVV